MAKFSELNCFDHFFCQNEKNQSCSQISFVDFLTPHPSARHGEVRCSHSAHLTQPCCDFWILLDIVIHIYKLLDTVNNKPF